MSFRYLLAACLVPAAAATADAQPAAAPGACAECVVVAPAPTSAADLSRRIGVGLHLSSFAIKNVDAPDDAEPRHLGGGGLQVRFRATPRWELELAFDALREHDSDGDDTGNEVHSGTLGVLHHFRPTRRWDWYLLAAVGGLHEADRDQGRGQFHLGIGLERRWRRFSLGAELRLVGIAPADDGDSTTVSSRTAGTVPPPPPPSDNERGGDAGARFSIGATYYF